MHHQTILTLDCIYTKSAAEYTMQCNCTLPCIVQGLKEKSLVDETLDKVDALKPIAKELGATLAQLALAWCARNPHVSTVIMGATKQHQVCQPFPSQLSAAASPLQEPIPVVVKPLDTCFMLRCGDHAHVERCFDHVHVGFVSC